MEDNAATGDVQPENEGTDSGKDTLTRAEAEAFAKEYAKEYATKKLRGSGKEISKLQSELERLTSEREEAAKAALAEQGEFKKLYEDSQAIIEAERAEKAAALAIVEDFKAKQAAKLEAIEEENLKLIEKIPEDYRDLIPENLDPETKAKQISNLMSKLTTGAKPGSGILAGAIRPPTPPANMTLEQKREANMKAAMAKMMGVKQ